MKKWLAVCLVLVFVFSASLALANTVNIQATFTDDTTTKIMHSEAAIKNDNEQYWYIRLPSATCTITSTNIFGARPNYYPYSGGTAYASTYRIWDYEFNTGKKYKYYDDLWLPQDTRIVLKGKKDDRSTSSSNLVIDGYFTP